jgi:hypothetical protein
MIKAKVISHPKNVVVLQGLRELDDKFLEAAAKGLRRGLEKVSTVAQREYLSGPRPERLDVRTRRLRNSISYDVRVTPKRGVIGRIGSNVAYARYHEFGFHGVQQVRAHKRVLHIRNAQGQEIELRRAWRDREKNFLGWRDSKIAALQRDAQSKRKKKASVFASSQNVSAHERKVNYAGRPYIAPALKKCEPFIREQIRVAIRVAKIIHES